MKTFQNGLLFIALFAIVLLAIPLVNDDALNSLVSFTSSLEGDYSPTQDLPSKATFESFNELTK